MHPALVYLPGDRLSQPELSAARLDGHVVELGDAYIPADLVESTAARAAAVVELLAPGLAASGPTAAWIHGAGDAPPSPHHAHRSTAKRVRIVPTHRLVFHDAPVDAEELMRIAGLPVTAPLRTMTDLALGLHRDPGFGVWMHALAKLHPHLTRAARDRLLSRRRVPGMRQGLRALDVLAARNQDEVTR